MVFKLPAITIPGVTRRTGLTALLFCVGLAGTPAAAQDLALKRDVPGENSLSCPAFPAPADPSERQRAEARRLLAQANQAALLGDQREARDYYRQAAQLDPTDAGVAYRLARTLEERGETDAAAREYCRFIALAPDSPDSPEVRGRINELAPPPTPSPQAIASFQEGIISFEQGRPEDAATAFTQTLRQAPAWTDLYYNRALAWEAQAESRRALRDFEQYLELRPAAGDAEMVRERIAALRAMFPGITPSNALVRGLIVPGLGQFSTGRPALGALVLGGAGAALLVGMRTEERAITVEAVDTITNNPYEYTDTVLVRDNVLQGVALAAGIAVLGAVEAYFHAERAASAPREERTPDTQAFARPIPFLRPAPGGGAHLGLSIRFGVR